MKLSVVSDDGTRQELEVDLSLAGFEPVEWLRLGFALGETDALTLAEGDPGTRVEMLQRPEVIRAVVWAKLVTAFPESRPDDLAFTFHEPGTPPPELMLTSQAVARG